MSTARTARACLRAPGIQGPVAGAVLLLHGGKADSEDRVARASLAAARMRPFAAAIERHDGRSRIRVFRLRNRLRGWNGVAADPVADALWAIERIEHQHELIPVVVVGHSMGGRAALRAAGHPRVAGVVALAPWVPEGEPVEQLRGRQVLIAHGDADRVTDPALSLSYARRAQTDGLDVEYRVVPRGDHAMLRSARAWHALAAQFSVRCLIAHSSNDDDEAFIP